MDRNESSSASGGRAAWHLPTAMALSAFAWMLLMAGHEVLGHGGACVALGGEALAVDAMYFTCSDLEPLWKDQLYRAAGSMFNVLVAIVSILLLRRLSSRGSMARSSARSWLGYFLWISAILNLLQSGQYVAFGRFIHPGMDWAIIVEAAPSKSLWAAIVTIVGVGLIVAGLVVGRLFESQFLSRRALEAGQGSLWRQKLRLLLTPYLTAAAISIGASLFVPSDDRLMMLMGGIGNSLFFLFPMLLLIVWPTKESSLLEGEPSFGRRPLIVAAGLLVTLLYVFVFSGGIEIG